MEVIGNRDNFIIIFGNGDCITGQRVFGDWQMFKDGKQIASSPNYLLNDAEDLKRLVKGMLPSVDFSKAIWEFDN